MLSGDRRFGYMRHDIDSSEDLRRSREFLKNPNISQPHSYALADNGHMIPAAATRQKRTMTPPPPMMPYPEHVLHHINANDIRLHQSHQHKRAALPPPPPPWLITATDNKSKHRSEFQQQQEKFNERQHSSTPRSRFPSPFSIQNDSKVPNDINNNSAVKKIRKPPLPSKSPTRVDTNTSEMVSRQLREWAADYAELVVNEHTKELKDALDNSNRQIDKLMQKCSMLEDQKVAMVMRGCKRGNDCDYSDDSANPLSYFNMLTMNDVVCVITTVCNRRQKCPTTSNNPLLDRMCAGDLIAGLINNGSVTTTCTTSKDMKLVDVTLQFRGSKIVLAPVSVDNGIEGDKSTTAPKSIMMNDVEEVSFMEGSVYDGGVLQEDNLPDGSHHSRTRNYSLHSPISRTELVLRREPTTTSEYAYVGDNQQVQVPQHIIQEEDNKVIISLQGPSEEASLVLYKAVQKLWSVSSESKTNQHLSPTATSPLHHATIAYTATPYTISSVFPPPLPARSPEMCSISPVAEDTVARVGVRPFSPLRDQTTARIIEESTSTGDDGDVQRRNGYEQIDVEETRLLAEVERLSTIAGTAIDFGSDCVEKKKDRNHFEGEKNVRRAANMGSSLLYASPMNSRVVGGAYPASRSPPRQGGLTGTIRSFEEAQYINKAWDRLFGASGSPCKTKYHPSKLPSARKKNMRMTDGHSIPPLSAADAAFMLGLDSQRKSNYDISIPMTTLKSSSEKNEVKDFPPTTSGLGGPALLCGDYDGTFKKSYMGLRSLSPINTTNSVNVENYVDVIKKPTHQMLFNDKCMTESTSSDFTTTYVRTPVEEVNDVSPPTPILLGVSSKKCSFHQIDSSPPPLSSDKNIEIPNVTQSTAALSSITKIPEIQVSFVSPYDS